MPENGGEKRRKANSASGCAPPPPPHPGQARSRWREAWKANPPSSCWRAFPPLPSRPAGPSLGGRRREEWEEISPSSCAPRRLRARPEVGGPRRRKQTPRPAARPSDALSRLGPKSAAKEQQMDTNQHVHVSSTSPAAVAFRCSSRCSSCTTPTGQAGPAQSGRLSRCRAECAHRASPRDAFFPSI